MSELFWLIVIVLITFKNEGIIGVLEFLKSIVFAVWEFLKMFNMISIELLGESILTKLFSHGIVFYIVGLIFSILYIPRSKIGKYIGKFLYKIIMYPVSSLLDFLGRSNIFRI